ncbi:MAG TPA: response regulator transcription factor [Gemmatimonadaceae bacterium]|nr:response regulator transcription factor [Gemmatimonadaceae bacterium]
MKRIAIVAESEELRRELVEALGDASTFEVVSSTQSAEAIDESADVVVTARPSRLSEHTSRDTVEMSGQPALPTQREREILSLLADGLGNKQIAARLGISPNTVKTHLEVLFDKLAVTSRAEAVAMGVRRGLLLL